MSNPRVGLFVAAPLALALVEHHGSPHAALSARGWHVSSTTDQRTLANGLTDVLARCDGDPTRVIAACVEFGYLAGRVERDQRWPAGGD